MLLPIEPSRILLASRFLRAIFAEDAWFRTFGFSCKNGDRGSTRFRGSSTSSTSPTTRRFNPLPLSPLLLESQQLTLSTIEAITRKTAIFSRFLQVLLPVLAILMTAP